MSDTRPIVLSHFQAHLSRALQKRGKQLLESDDLQNQVPALEPLEAYFIIKELGVDDAGPLLRHCTPEQLQTFVDLDCWNGDRPDDVELDAWLAPFAELGPEALVEAFKSLDEELQVWYLQSSLHIWDPAEIEHQPDPAEGVTRKTTPDTFFIVESRTDTLRELDPLDLLDAIYETDLEEGFRLLTAARWESTGPLEESALHFRAARAESLGFPSQEQALTLFKAPPKNPPPPAKVAPGTTASLPAVYAGALRSGSLLTRALEKITSPDLLGVIEERLMVLINHAIVAYRRAPGNIHQATLVAEQVRDTVSLGLESLISDEPAFDDEHPDEAARRASDLLSAWDVMDLFRQGYEQVRPLHEAARQLSADPVVAHWLAKTETEHDDYSQERMDREFLRALATHPPLHAGFDPIAPRRTAAFAKLREVRDADLRLKGIADQRA